jgi:hypothetical protein
MATPPAPVAWNPPAPGFSTPPTGTDPRGTQTYRAVQRIQRSVTIYLIIPLLTALDAIVITAAVLVTGAFVVGNFGGSGIGGLVESNSAAISITGELVAFVGLILTIVAWLTWRGGVKQLAAAGGEYGPEQTKAAQGAEKDYSYAVYTWIATLFFGIGAAVVVFLFVLSAVADNINKGESGVTAAANALTALVGLLLVIAIVSLLLTILLYHFASRSLVRSISALATPSIRAKLDRGRMLILVGAALGIAGEGALVSSLLYPLALISPIVLLVGFLSMRSGYGEWLGSPPPPTYTPAPWPQYPSTGAFPSAPPPPPPPAPPSR